MSIQELALTESRSLRAQYADRTDVLTRVNALVMFPDDMHLDTEMVAAYFGVTAEAISQLVKRNRAELAENGYRSITGSDLREFVAGVIGDTRKLSPMARSLALFTRRSVLNLAMLMDGNNTAQLVRTYLLNAEEEASRPARGRSVDWASAWVPATYTWTELAALIRQTWGFDFGESRLRQLLRSGGVLRQCGAVPKSRYKDWFWFTGSAWEVKNDFVPALVRNVETTIHGQGGPRFFQLELGSRDDREIGGS